MMSFLTQMMYGKLMKHALYKWSSTLILSTPNKLSPEGLKGVFLQKVIGREWKAWDTTHKKIYTSFEILNIIKKNFKINKTIGYYYDPTIRFIDNSRFFNQVSSKLKEYWTSNIILSRFGFNFIIICSKN